MSLDRRSFLKSLLVMSAVPLVNCNFVRAMTDYPASESYLLLQGLFFLEFHKNKLIVATPNHEHHVFYKRTHRQQDLISMPTDPLYSDLLPGNVSCFPPEIPQFTYCTIKQPEGFLRNASHYRCKMVLPYPKEIFALRKGLKSDFQPDPSTNVGGSLECNSDKIATIVCLAYDLASGAKPYIESYYAEHPSNPNTCQVNDALISAKELCGQDFNLRMQRVNKVAAVPFDNDDDLPGDLDYTDEFSFGEIVGLSTAKINDPQGSISSSTCSDSSQKQAAHKKTKCDGSVQKPTATKKPNIYIPHSESSTDQSRNELSSNQKSNNVIAGDVSSCPIFGVHGG